MTRATRRTRRSRQYPLATLAPYGPDNTLATKLVVSVIERPHQFDPSEMRTWTTQAVDVRDDPTIAADVAGFLRAYGVTHSTMADRILGCPHQEGVDYPMGRSCPLCPFWAGRDRFTHEPVTMPEPTMSVSEVLAALSEDGPEPPWEALDSADGHRDALVEPLLAALERGITHPDGASPGAAILFSYALYLFAKWRDIRAYPDVIRWLSLRGEAPFEIGGDIVTQDSPRILAAVCDGDLEPIKTLVVNRDANEYGRSSGLGALGLLVAWAEVPRDPVVEYFQWLAQEGLDRQPSQVWNGLASACVDIEAWTVFPALRTAYATRLIEPLFIAPDALDEAEALPPGRMLEETREREPPIDDVAEATAWWDRCSDADDDDDAGEDWDDEGDSVIELNEAIDGDGMVDGDDAVAVPEPYRAPATVGRNEACPCGSGKKFKKCCGR